MGTTKSAVMQWSDTSFTPDMVSNYLGTTGSTFTDATEDTAKSAVSVRQLELSQAYEWYHSAVSSEERLKAGLNLKKILERARRFLRTQHVKLLLVKLLSSMVILMPAAVLPCNSTNTLYMFVLMAVLITASTRMMLWQRPRRRAQTLLCNKICSFSPGTSTSECFCYISFS